MRNTRNRVSVAIANELILILREKRLQVVINDNEAEMDKTGLEAEGKCSGGKSFLFYLKDSHFMRFATLIIMVATNEVTGNLY